MKLRRVILWVGCLLGGFGQTAALASKDYQAPVPACPGQLERARGGGEGGGMPDPLSVYNQRVELADSELYLLLGTVRILPNWRGNSAQAQAYLQVDLKAHPWLTNQNHRAAALYPIEGKLGAWKPYDGIKVKLAARAESWIRLDSSGVAHGLIVLDPIIEASTIPWSENDQDLK
ncbi:hypothetical protein WDW37_14705 [Bdellovibrionota bacterium FG-1]